MNTVLNNDLKLVGFDVDTFSKGPSIYRIVMVEQDPTGRVEPFTSKEEMSEVFIKENGSLCFSVSGLQIGNNLISADILENDPSKIFETIFSNIGFDEVIMYLNLDFVGTYFLKQLRRYAEKNDMRFYILSRQILPAKYSFVSDFCCQYRPDGEFVVTSNKIGPTTAVLKCLLPVEKFEPSKPQYGRQVTIKEEHTWMSDKFKKQGVIRSQMERAKPHLNKNTYAAPIIVKGDDSEVHPSWSNGCVMYKDYIIKELMNNGMSYEQAIDYLDEHFNKYSDVIKNIFLKLSNEVVGGYPRHIVENIKEATSLKQEDVNMNKHHVIKETEETQAVLAKPEPLDFNVISPMEQTININYRGDSTIINCDTVQETLNLSDEVTKTIEKIEKTSKESILIDVRITKDSSGRLIEYELRQNLDGRFVITSDVYFGSAKMKLPIENRTYTPAVAIAKWVNIK